MYVLLAASTEVADCQHGEVRLVDGPNVREGKVEVCINNAWGSVCSTRFGADDAAVLCLSGEFAREGVVLLISHTYTCLSRSNYKNWTLVRK